MSEHTEYTPGTFNWVDLATSDTEAAKGFYSEVFGWSFEDVPVGDAGVYSLASVREREVAGLFEKGPEQEAVPPHWNSYVAVASADEAAAKASSLRGTLMAEPFDVMEAGRMAMVMDPGGAVVALWEARQHAGAGLVNEHGALCWNELCTRDTAKAAEFYTGLFGWTAEEEEMSMGQYTMFKNDGNFNGGMMEIPEDWGDVPLHWTAYFAVDDCDGAVSTATSNGGNVVMGPMDLPEVGRIATLSDPQGATFAVIQLANQPE